MNHAEFDWDYENITHLARHGVTPEEAEDVLLGGPLDLGDEYVEGEWRFSSIGVTRSGRFLIILATPRRKRLRVITGYPPSARLIREFLQSRNDR
jgi:uncharacterized DUF497 family protein